MGDALMQVLDLADQIHAADPGSTGGASPSPDASAAPTPGSSAAPSPDSSVDTPTGEPIVAAILLSDGANSVGAAEPLDAAERAASMGVPIYTIALGTEAGRVQVQDQFGQSVTLDVPPDTETLAQIAEITSATAFDAPTADQLAAVYDNLQSRIGYTEETQEVTSWFAAGALALVVVAAGLSAVWFGRLP